MQHDLGALAAELHAAATAYWQSRPRVPAGLYRMSELPDETEPTAGTRAVVIELGHRLADHPDGNLMSQVYDEAVDRYGYEGVRGVSHLWTGIAGWAA